MFPTIRNYVLTITMRPRVTIIITNFSQNIFCDNDNNTIYLYVYDVIFIINTNIPTRIQRFKSRQSSKILVPDSTFNYICRLRLSFPY